MNFIGGKWVAARSGRTMDDRNPADNDDLLGEVASSDGADIDDAVAAARAGYADWFATPMPKRGDYLRRIGNLLESQKDSLAELMTREMGKTLKEARGDVQEGIDFAFFMAGQSRAPMGEAVRSELPREFSLTLRHPIGIVGLITPWNFPIAIPTWKSWPALLAGNCVIMKAAEDTPLCAQRLVEIIDEAGVPAGVMNLVQGTGESAGAALVQHPDVRAISITGSFETGRRRAGHLVHRFVGDGPAHRGRVRPADEALLDGAGVEERHHRDAGRRCRAGCRRHRLGGVRDQRAAVPGHVASGIAEPRLRRCPGGEGAGLQGRARQRRDRRP